MFIIILFTLLLLLTLSTQFITIKEVNTSFEYFLKMLIILSFAISIYAIYATNGKTLFWSYLLIILVLLLKKKIQLKQFELKNFFYNISYLLYLIPILILQCILHFNFSKLEFKIPSDDIIVYASYSKQIVEFGQENKYALFSHFYPKLFNGVNPYHFYELWLNALVSLLNKNESIYNLIFITYPLLIWMAFIGLISILDNFKINKIKSKLFALLFLFIGPLYFQAYEFLFKDGNLVNYAVFTIPGFVKQTLPFSYFGQKHLPVILFSIVLVNFAILEYWKSTLISIHALIIASFGLFPGAYSLLIPIFLKVSKNKKSFFIVLAVLSFITFFGLLQINKLGISKDISNATFYFNFFLTDLNWKGEILRVIYKLTIPFLWFVILYIPYLIIILLNYKTLLKNKIFKTLMQIILFSYLGASCFTLILEGLNTEQFITNLLPLYNIIFITIIILIISQKTEKSFSKRFILSSIIIAIVIVQNVYFTVNFHRYFKDVYNDKYQKTTQKKILHKFTLDKTRYIAFLLSDSTVAEYDPMHQYVKLPAKFLYNHDYFNQVNINYPYQEYPKNSSYYTFAPYNQMKYFLNNKKITKSDFVIEQLNFLRKYRIKWVLCEKNAKITTLMRTYCVDSVLDKLSGEKYYKLSFNKNHF